MISATWAIVFILGTAATAELPPPRPPAAPFPAEPPTAEMVRRMHEMMPPHDGEPMSEEEMQTSFRRFLDARGGRIEPIWANHSHAERTANLQFHHAKRQSERRRAQSERRRMQGWLGNPLFDGDSVETKQNHLVAVLEPAGSTCDDPLATNAGRAPPCTYDCADLTQEYFPEPQSQTTRCFLFDPATETWPEVGGQEDELLSMREQRFETHTYISRAAGTNPPPSGLSFTMGEGRVCQDVAVKSFVGSETHTETFCLVDGEHEYNHTITEQHSVEVVGYAESGVHDGAGGTTSFVVGMCTDALIRVTTTRAGGSSMTWSLDDGGHNGPWSFEVADGVGVVEFETCIFDNEFTLTRQGGSAWEGSVEVAGFIHYHNTITIPNDENWIVQGRVDPASGLPSSLDGRLKSGTAVDRSHANIVLRHMRISGQVAPVDVNLLPRLEVIADQPAFGGALDYDGGSADPSNLVQIVFVGLVFDHNSAIGCGGAGWIDGRGGKPGGSLDPTIQNWESGISLTMVGCTFYRNFASFCTAALEVIDGWPLTWVAEDTDWVHNDALVIQHDSVHWSPPTGPQLRAGTSSFTVVDNHYDGGYSSTGVFAYCCDTHVRIDGEGPDEPEARWVVAFQGCDWVDHSGWWSWLISIFVSPVLPDTKLWLESSFVENSIADAVILTPGNVNDGVFLANDMAQGRAVFERSRFERSGNFNPDSIGLGAFQAIPPSGGSIAPSWELTDSVWVGNACGNGPAFYMMFGNFNLLIRRCVFRENTAYLSGGAISVMGSEASTLQVEGSVFDNNAVRMPMDGSEVDVTVRVNTGGFAIGAPAGYSVPIWRIDDGPVFGIPWEHCQSAMQRSQDAEFAGSWPNLRCANMSYTGPDSSFAHVVGLSQGGHKLWTGSFIWTGHQNLGWQQAWIEIGETIGPLYPATPETRSCMFGQCSGPPDYCGCPRGMIQWTSFDFTVSSGKGGGIATSGPLAVAISDTSFRANEAPKGASLSVTAATTLRITNTTIEEPEDETSTAVWTVASQVDSCVENPCEAGSQCTFKDFSTFCEPCGENEFGEDGLSCDACQPGTQPDDSHTQCLSCGPGQYSQIGICIFCPAGKTSSEDRSGCTPCEPGTYRSTEEPSCTQCLAGSQPNPIKTGCDSCTLSGQYAYSPDGQECRDCPARNAPNYERTECFCQTNTYNALELGGVVTCRGTSFTSTGMEDDECAVCPSCLDCAVVGQTALKSGWAFFGTRQAYPCPGAGKFEACPPLLLNDNTTMGSSTCAMGYEGPVCGNCAPEYNHLKVGNPCDACDDGVVNVPLVMGLAFGGMAGGGAAISGVVGVLQDNGIITDMRILVGFYQILGQASNVLDLSFPDPVPDLVGFIKLLFLDVRNIVMLDCWDVGGFYGKIVTNIVAVPAFIVGVCMLIYISQKRTLAAVIAAGAADTSGLETLKVKLKQNLFVGIFLVYPTITTTLFRVPQCQYFGDAGFHEDDYTIDCGTNRFFATVAFAIFVILLIPIGVPVVFLIFMLRAKQANGGVVNETALGGAKLVADDDDDESDTYGFLIRDYRPQYWYHEIVTYFRKLMLGGISVVMGRGTIAQTYFVISIEAFFQMHHMRTYPFVVYKHNVMEALGHCSLMLLYAITLILRNEDEGTWDAEWFPKTGYGWFIVFLFAMVLPSPTVYFYCRDDDTSATSDGKLGEGFEENPLAIELGESAAADDKDEEPTAQPGRAKLAKMQREGKDARAQVQKLQVENQQKQVEIQQLQDDNQQLQDDNQQLQEEILQLESQGQMDGDAVRQSEAALRKENATLKAQMAEAPQQPAGTELVVASDDDANSSVPEQPPVAKSQEASMKELAADESLSEEARDSARKALEVLVSSQLLDIEQAAALKKLESESLFADRQTRIEALAAAKKVEVEALAKAKTTEAAVMLQAAEIKEIEAKAAAEVAKLETAAQAKRNKADATKLLHAPEGLSEDMMGWLQRNRLQQCATDLARIAGETVLPSDLQYLTDEDVEEIGGALTRVEKKRLQAAVQAQCGAPLLLSRT